VVHVVLISKKRIFSEKEKAFLEKSKVCQYILQPKTAAKVKFPDKQQHFEKNFRVKQEK
jgi:hypothetical protein